MEKNLKTYFPEIGQLHQYQKQSLEKILSGKNTLAIVPTGGGKSLIYQLGALCTEGITLVISPLIALMSEQVTELQKKGIAAIAINSSLSFIKQRDILRELKSSDVKIIYLSPERLSNGYFKKALIHSQKKINLIAIDEAHCISQWGDDFRPEYSQIKGFIDFLKSEKTFPIILALTATLSKQPRKEIISAFNINDKDVVIDKNMIRTNLILNFKKVEKEEDKIDLFLKFIDQPKINAKKVVVYLYSKRKCEEFSKNIIERGYTSDYFHAGMSDEKKEKVYKAFKNNEIRILFATSAFGMGINIPDIDSVVHLHLPNSIEEYYQQVGRGGRKIDKCYCLLLWSETNFERRKSWIENGRITVESLNEIYDLLVFSNNKNEIKRVKNENFQDNGNFNLPLIRCQFEKNRIIKFIGTVNGSPLKIRFKKQKIFWQKYVKDINGIDDFEYACEVSNTPILNVIDFLHKEDLEGNIEHLPAMEKHLFFEINYNQIPRKVAEKIVQEVDDIIDKKLIANSELHQMIVSKSPIKIISKKLGASS